MSLTNRLTNLELLMTPSKHPEMFRCEKDPKQEIYRRGAARKRLEFFDTMDCDTEESSVDFASSFKRVGIADDFLTLPHVVKPLNFEQMTKRERGFVRKYATIYMDEDDVDTCSAQFKRRRCQ